MECSSTGGVPGAAVEFPEPGRPAVLGLVRGIFLNRGDSNVRIPSGVERT